MCDNHELRALRELERRTYVGGNNDLPLLANRGDADERFLFFVSWCHVGNILLPLSRTVNTAVGYTECTMLFPPELVFAWVFVVIVFILLTRPRRFYFIRHGETVLNAQHIRQGEDGALSENGRQQTEKLGSYLKRFSVRRIIASTYPRAKETAAIISESLKVPVMYSPLLVERKSPSEIVGKSTRDPDVIRIADRIDLEYHEDEYRFSDEENFIDLKKRARTCLNLLALQGTHGIVVVTHHVFLKMLVAYLLYRERLHAADFVKLSFFNYSDNASITICEFNPWEIFSPTVGWRVISYNEQPE